MPYIFLKQLLQEPFLAQLLHCLAQTHQTLFIIYSLQLIQILMQQQCIILTYQMTARQLIQFIVYPKLFQAVDFYNKGLYHIDIKLEAQDQKGHIITAHPTLFQTSKAQKIQHKRAKIDIFGHSYKSQHFYILFAEETILLKTFTSFKIQYQISKKYKTYIIVKLQCQEVQKKKVKQSTQIQYKPFSRTIASQKIYINLEFPTIQSKKLIFSDQICFSYLDMLFVTNKFQYKIRRKQYQLSQFSLFTNQTKLRLHLQKRKKIRSPQNVSNIIQQAFKSNNVKQFYQKLIHDSLESYEILTKIYNSVTHHQQKIKRFHLLNYIQLPNQSVNMKKLLKIYEVKSQFELYLQIFEENKLIVQNSRYVWSCIIQLLHSIQYESLQKIFEQNSIRELYQRNQLFTMIQDKDSKRSKKKKLFSEKRNKIQQHLNLYDEKDKNHPLLILQQAFDDVISRNSTISQRISIYKDSLTIFVHGYQGSSVDMQVCRNYLSIYQKNSYFILINSITGDYDKNIQFLAEALAIQVDRNIKTACVTFKKMNFIGFSMGGILCRAALKYLSEYKNKFNLLVTFGSPHLGISIINNQLINTGVWYMIKYQGVKNLQQLLLPQDSSEQSYLMKLSKQQSLTWLKKCIVVSCKQDQFIPWYSAKIQQNHYHKQINEISKNIKNRLKCLQRIQVWFDADKKSSTIDKILGRRSHIQFLQNNKFLNCFFQIYGKQF